MVPVDLGPGSSGPIFVSAQEPVTIGVERAPVIGPIIRIIVSRAVESACAIAGFELTTAHAAVMVEIPIAIGLGMERVPFVTADEAVIVDVHIAIAAADAAWC